MSGDFIYFLVFMMIFVGALLVVGCAVDLLMKHSKKAKRFFYALLRVDPDRFED